MTHWTDFASAAPMIAAEGRALLAPSGTGDGLLSTVRGDGLPRIHPVSLEIVEGRLLVFVINGSAKAIDLAEDGRYALHAHQDQAVPHEFLVRGRATRVDDAGLRATAVAAWSFEVDDGYTLYELGIEHAVLGRRASADVWPPVYTSWRAEPGC